MIDWMNNGRTELLDLDHGTVQMDIDGAGHDLVVIHSLLTGPEAFDTVVSRVEGEIRFHRLHLPGFGSSSPLPGPDVTIQDLAGIVAASITGAGLGSEVTVLGNGLGSFIALALAIGHGDIFGRLIVANTGPGFPPERREPFLVMAETALADGMSGVADMAVSRIFPASYLETHQEAPGERRAVLETIDPRAFAAACRALAILDLRHDIEAISNPTLVVVGEIDQTTPPEMGKEVAAHIPESRFEVIPGCGHCPQLERPDRLASLIRDFTLGS